jgi:hypothetical protein
MAFGRNPGWLILVKRYLSILYQTFDETLIESPDFLCNPNLGLDWGVRGKLKRISGAGCST